MQQHCCAPSNLAFKAKPVRTRLGQALPASANHFAAAAAKSRSVRMSEGVQLESRDQSMAKRWRPVISWLAGGATVVLAASMIALPWSAGIAQARSSNSDVGDILTGQPRIVDGDTLVVGDERIRLFGVDAPETKQMCTSSKGQAYTCGEASTKALRDKVGSGKIECKVRAKDLYQRNVSSCTLPDKEDMGDWLVKNGYAVAYREYSKDYVKDEEIAKKEHRGIWQGDFQIPAEWRKAKKADTKAGKDAAPLAALPQALALKQGASPPPGCNVKGNISAKGARIYHIPGGRYYDSVRIEPEKGEAFFCSEQEAQQAGFRKSRE